MNLSKPNVMEPLVQTYQNLKHKNCKSCGVEFKPNSGRQDYCSIGCKTEFLRKPTPKRLLNCSHCGQEFQATGSTSKFCSVHCRTQYTRHIKYSHVVNRVCEGCGIGLEQLGSARKFCTTTCARKHRAQLKYQGTEGMDFVTCPVCQVRTRQFTPKHAKMHGYASIADMARSLNISKITCDSKREDSSGVNNPAFQHNGRLSAWSKNFQKGYDSDRHAQAKQNHSKWVRTHRQQNSFSLEYWRQHADSDEAALELYKKSQTRDLAWFTEKYGVEEGKRRHREKTEKWLKTLNSKSVEELTLINSRKVKKSGCFYSKLEKELFNELLKLFPDLRDQLGICRDHTADVKKFYLYDMALENKIIEFHGDFWHANPEVYHADFVNPYTKKTQDEIFVKDADKMQVAIDAGYQVHMVWEQDYRKNKQEVLQECITFLTRP